MTYSRYIPVSGGGGGGGSGTVTEIDTGTGLTGGPITTSGTILLLDTTVTPGTYGDSTHVGQFTVDQQGRLTAAANIAVGGGSVTSVAVSGGTTGLTTSGGPITTSGTITVAGTLIVANGGTGDTTLTSHGVLYGNGTSAVGVTAAGTTGQVLTGATGSAPVWATAAVTAPAGSTGDIQFNTSGAFAADTGKLFWDATNNRLGIGTGAPGYPVDVVADGNVGVNVQTPDFVPFIGSNLGGPNQLWLENYRGAKLDISNGSSFLQIWDDASTVSTQILARHTRHLYLGADGTSASKGVVVIGSGGQTGDLLQMQLADTTVMFSVSITGNVSMPVAARVGSAGAPVTSAALDVSTTTGALVVPRMTTTQKNALTATNGMIVYDTTLNKFSGYENGAWVSFVLV